MFQIIPAIDLIDAKCVRLTKGDYDTKKIYNEDPLEVAKEFEDHGITRLHLVDLDGAKQKKVINFKVLEKIASQTKLKIDFGGGVQSDEDIQKVFDFGASQITGGSIAVKNPEKMLSWVTKYGGDRIILGADAKDRKIAISGWEEDSGQDIMAFIETYTAAGIKYIISTDVDKDGLLAGPAFELYEEMKDMFPECKIIASGGVSEMKDIEKLAEQNLYGVIVGKAIYEGRISLSQIENFMIS
ncbi:1-(5-phosphoribosyl)-5-[(5-phosphoribosylamino)methylideneamino]imidazole-4-carboxamide isomerase [Jiulongibacter sediminis]|uniref:1-(5-phosphoribosyl)-5-[(5-phosphoribosylamino)methylideneamino] imidazole-4-carboxamide isomerase n=1 Tax=Jiulongibacter sediminis TaxID=1605367 RepID=A0A0P7BBX5_9BACT|nr:1-(5-phosphoribosyl)-5-[(5-phosphoribosylamino)methylideneamino]imidazole-4-carboxamide isomerase [Jiulongibacter sediminis]KPM48018.1 1-(5-phosphoribosyl)-5-[(5-phosphoribosylamino)methylideneamino] imidazole-4-carboxamide isomerase [Jiulongibacter sediminis]TBX24200.1 1-(5-phosphoribosyl)-5-[(5-phosphoribosylamino)methylideneamino] imidazole-4-carboxamide isomerase [Jiulongibacter sediminis]